MATLAIGDVHGCLGPLIDLLGQVAKDATADDTVVFLGDYIDRGAQTRECVDAILEFRHSTAAQVVCLRGNHEDWFLQTRHDYTRHSWLLVMDAWATIRSYSLEAAHELKDAADAAGGGLYGQRVSLPYERLFDAIPEPHLEFFDSLALYHESRDCICVHAGVDPSIPELKNQPWFALLTGCAGFPAAYTGRDLIVYGHRNNARIDSRGWPGPAIIGNTIGLDTISHGVLTGMRITDRKVYQSARYARRSELPKG